MFFGPACMFSFIMAKGKRNYKKRQKMQP